MSDARPLFHVKICGVTSAADAAVVAEAGADALGLNFVPGSPRFVDVETARAVAAATPPGVLVVGVFAGMPPPEILGLVRAVGLGAVQLHGHLHGPGTPVDPPESCALLVDVPVIRAVRLGTDGLAAARRWIAAATALRAPPALALVDAGGPGALGGTGRRVDWETLAREPALGLPWALAGGLDAANVTAAIRVTGARAVDVASGVESAPGRKDPSQVRAFVSAARAAFSGGPVRPPVGG